MYMDRYYSYSIILTPHVSTYWLILFSLFLIPNTRPTQFVNYNLNTTEKFAKL